MTECFGCEVESSSKRLKLQAGKFIHHLAEKFEILNAKAKPQPFYHEHRQDEPSSPSLATKKSVQVYLVGSVTSKTCVDQTFITL